MAGFVDVMPMRLDVLGDLVLDRLLQRPAGAFAGDLFQGDNNDRLGCQPQAEMWMMTCGVSFLASWAERVTDSNQSPKVRRFYCRVIIHSFWS